MFFSSFFRFFALSRGQCDRWIVFFFHGFMERPWVNAIAIAKFVIYRNIYICILNICKQQFTNDFSTDTATRLLKPCSANKRISSQKLLASLSLSNKSIPAWIFPSISQWKPALRCTASRYRRIQHATIAHAILFISFICIRHRENPCIRHIVESTRRTTCINNSLQKRASAPAEKVNELGNRLKDSRVLSKDKWKEGEIEREREMELV